MPRQCAGFSRTLYDVLLSECPYDAEADSDLCYFHIKVREGKIVTLDGKIPVSWMPKKVAPAPTTPAEEDQLVRERLLAEWDLSPAGA